MLKLKIPEEITNLIANIFNGRKNAVITNFGMMSTYDVENGVDQDKTIAPLLW
ncbi:6039_t:CDS:1, partial [Gigaspora rosea]